MNIVRVYPLASLPRGLGHSFTYFTTRELSRGALVEVEIGRRKMPAVVVGTENVETLKGALKHADWRIKRINRVVSDTPVVSEIFFSLAAWASDYFLIPPGLFLKQFIPSALLNKQSSSYEVEPRKNFYEVRPQMQATHIRTAIGTREDRARLWANEAREALARRRSLFLITPTVALANHFVSLLSHLPRPPFLLTGEIPTAQLRTRWEEIRSESNGIVVIGTPIAIGAIRPDTETVIVDDASSPHFWQREFPYLPLMRVMEKFSAIAPFSLWKGKRITSLADLAAPTGITYVSPRRKQYDKPTFSLVDLRHDERLSSVFHRNHKFSLLSRESIEAINCATDKRIICFVNHRGYGTMLLCKDCGTPAICPSCAIPLRLHVNPRTLACHHCGFRKAASDRCPQCGSWNIEIYGIGIERVEEALQEQFPSRSIMRLDADTQKNKKRKEALRKKFFEEKNAVLLTTEIFLEDPLLVASLILVPSLDFLFTFPELDFAPRFLRLLWDLADRAEESIVIQTFFPVHALFKAFNRGDPEGILREELKRRSEHAWPPFSLLIKITASFTTPEESRAVIEHLADKIKKISRNPAEPMAIQAYSAFIPKEKNLWRYHLLLRVDPTRWADGYKDIKNLFFTFNSSYSIIVDPLSTL